MPVGIGDLHLGNTAARRVRGESGHQPAREARGQSHADENEYSETPAAELRRSDHQPSGQRDHGVMKRTAANPAETPMMAVVPNWGKLRRQPCVRFSIR